MQISPPEGRATFESDIAIYWFDNGILVAISKNVKRTVDLIRSNVELVQQMTKGKKVPLLIYLASSPVPDKATRQFSSQQLPLVYSAMAMISKPGLSQLIMKLLFKFNSPPIPMKSFTNDADAKKWLKKFINAETI